MKKVRNIVVAIPAIIFILTIVLIFRISISLKNEKIPKVFGFSFMEVQTGSMEPTIYQYDFIVNKTKKEYFVGDIISFHYDINDDGSDAESVTHRIILIKDDGSYILKGDAIELDSDDFAILEQKKEIQVIPKDKIIGKVVFKSSAIGKIFQNDLLKNRNFIFLFLIGSLVIFMIYQSFNVFKLLKESHSEEEKAKEELQKSSEEKVEESDEDIEAQIAKLQAKLKEKEQKKSDSEENND